jgi:hypothetical protein
VPAPLPPDPPVAVHAVLLALLSRADLALGRLDGVAPTRPNADRARAQCIAWPGQHGIAGAELYRRR